MYSDRFRGRRRRRQVNEFMVQMRRMNPVCRWLSKRVARLVDGVYASIDRQHQNGKLVNHVPRVCSLFFCLQSARSMQITEQTEQSVEDFHFSV